MADADEGRAPDEGGRRPQQAATTPPSTMFQCMQAAMQCPPTKAGGRRRTGRPGKQHPWSAWGGLPHIRRGARDGILLRRTS